MFESSSPTTGHGAAGGGLGDGPPGGGLGGGLGDGLGDGLDGGLGGGLPAELDLEDQTENNGPEKGSEEAPKPASDDAPQPNEGALVSDEKVGEAEQPGSEKPADEQPASEKPASEQPASEKPASEKPASEKPADEKPASEKPADEKPADEKPADEKPADEKPVDRETPGPDARRQGKLFRGGKKGEVAEISFEDVNLGMPVGAAFRPFMLTDRVKSLEGKRVRIKGFVMASDRTKGMKEFVFLRNTECKFGPGGQADHLLRVFMRKGETAAYRSKPVSIEGVLRVKPFPSSRQTWSVFDLEDATGIVNLSR